ncbi:hypothetical protein D6779_02615 [Candidatus Parcubacteria bacterium]|nr:MAG: hypothetical protein D6779_02615 [Candidatus Parcubacteria bacterium]
MGLKSLRQILAFVLAGLLLSILISLSQAQSPPQEDDAAHIQRLYTGFAPQRVLLTDPISQTEDIASSPQSPMVFGQGWSVATFSEYQEDRWEVVLVEPGTARYSSYLPSGDQIEPHLNSNGTEVVFTSVKNNVSRIYKANKDTLRSLQTWVLLADNASYPNWSPDDSKIVFQSTRDGQSEIYLINADGTGLTRLTNNPEYDGQPSFSRDGKHIYFVSRRNGGYRVYRMNLDGSDVTQVTWLPYCAYPYEDGEYIWFSADNNLDGWQEIWRVPINSDGYHQHLVHQPPAPHVDLQVYSTRMGGAYSELHWVQYQGQWYLSRVRMKRLKSFWGLPSFGNDRSLGYDWASKDTTPPTTKISLPAVSSAFVPIYPVAQDTGGAGVVNTEVQYRDRADGTWITLTEVGASWYPFGFSGIGGHTYDVRARSVDHGENVEPWPATPQASTTIETVPPHSIFTPLSSTFQLPTFSWPVIAWDEGLYSWVHTVSAEFRESGTTNPWQAVQAVQKVTYQRDYYWLINFQGVAGHSYEFRLRAQDGGKTWEAWHQYPDPIRIYSWGLKGTTFDIAHTPLANVQAHLARNETGSIPSDTQGHYKAYGVLNSSQQISWGFLGGNALLTKTLTTSDDVTGTWRTVSVVLPPHDNLITNPGFENHLAGWIVSGTYTTTLSAASHTGAYALSMGVPPQVASWQTLVPFWYLPSSPVIFTGRNDTQHAIWQQGSFWYYAEKQPGQNWSTPQLLYDPVTQNELHAVVLLSDGTMRLLLQKTGDLNLWVVDRTVTGTVHAQRSQIPIPASATLSYAYDGNDIHIVYHYLNTQQQIDAFYTRLSATGTFSTPERVPLPQNAPAPSSVQTPTTSKPQIPVIKENESRNLFVDQDGNVYFFWKDYLFTRSADTHTWSTEQIPLPATGNTQGLGIYQDTHKRIHLFVNTDQSYRLYHLYKENGQWYQDWSQSLPTWASGYSLVDSTGTLYLAWTASDTLQFLRLSKEGSLEVLPPLQREHACINVDTLAFQPTSDGVAFSANLGFYYWSSDSGWHEFYPDFNKPLWMCLFGDQASSSVDSQGRPSVLLDNGGIFYTTFLLLPVDSSARVEQRITIPLTMTHPTLSFIASHQRWTPPGEWAPAIAIVGNKIVTPTWQSQPLDAQWTHYWADVSAWAGQSVTITFYLKGKAGLPYNQILIDEVMLGSAYPDGWVQWRLPPGALPGEVVKAQVSFGNRSHFDIPDATLQITLPDLLHVVSTEPANLTINNNVLTWTIGTLQAGVRDTITIWAQVQTPPPWQDRMMLNAQLLFTSPDANPDDNRATAVMDFQKRVFLPLMLSERR